MHLAAANAVNGPVSSVAILNRGTWDGDIHLIGHEAPVEVCAFSPRLYGTQPSTKQNVDGRGHTTQHLVTVVACAGQDKALSVWITSNPRPLMIAQDIANKSISDLAWAPDGRTLYATSLDGTIVAVVFEEGDLGYPMDPEENEKSLQKFGTGRKGVGVIETPDALLLEERSRAGELKGVEGRMGALMGDGHDSAEKPVNGDAAGPSGAPPTNVVPPVNGASTNGQTNGETPAPPPQEKVDPDAAKLERLKNRVTITKDGKKRIAPLLVSGSGGAESSLPQTRLVAASAAQGAANDAPQSVVDLSKPFDGLPKGGLGALLFGNKRKFAAIEGDDDGHVEKRMAVASRNGATPIVVNTPDGLVPAQSSLPPTGQEPTPQWIRPSVVNPSLLLSHLRLAVPKIRSKIVRSLNASGKPSAPVDASASTNAPDASNTDYLFEARNPGPQPVIPGGRAGADREPARITVTRRGQPLWQDFVPKNVLLTTGNKNFWAAACEDGSIYLWTQAGRRLVNPLCLDAQAVILECKDWYLLCITAVGQCHVWDLRTLSSPHPPISLAPVLDAALHNMQPNPTVAPAITSARLNSEGRIIIALTNGDGYSYSPQMYTWQRLSEVWWAVGSQYWNTTDASVGNLASTSGQKDDTMTSVSNVSAGIIPFLERNTTNETLLRGRAYFLQRLIKALLSREGFETFESNVSVAHLENRVAAALSLGAKEEFRVYLFMYAKRLGAEGLRMKVEELLRTLLGDIFEDEDEATPVNVRKKKAKSDRSWEEDSEMICGWPREELVKGIVLMLGKLINFLWSSLSPGSVLHLTISALRIKHSHFRKGKHRDLQRLTVPYAQLLGIMEEAAAEDEAMTS